MPKQDLKLWRPLAGYEAEKEKQVEALTQQRTGLKNELKRHICFRRVTMLTNY